MALGVRRAKLRTHTQRRAINVRADMAGKRTTGARLRHRMAACLFMASSNNRSGENRPKQQRPNYNLDTFSSEQKSSRFDERMSPLTLCELLFSSYLFPSLNQYRLVNLLT